MTLKHEVFADSLVFPDNSTKNISVSHIGDGFLSGDLAKGNVINVLSIPEEDSFNQHSNGTFNTELNFILNTLEGNTNKSTLINEVIYDYRNYDKNRDNGGQSKVNTGG